VSRLDYRRVKAVVVGLTALAPTIERHYEQGWVLLQEHSEAVGRQVRLVFGSDLPEDAQKPAVDLSGMWSTASNG
jgi:hypothetical protein